MNLGLFTKARATHDSVAATREACAQLGLAVDQGGLGDIVAKHETLILKYYGDVQDQANKSFASARFVAAIGFWMLTVTLGYILVFDALTRLKVAGPSVADMSLSAAHIGVVSGVVIEFIAAINFVLYAKGAKQFGAFHICLERTHRYLLAYKIADVLETNRDETLQRLVCIMANAPMINATGAASSPPGALLSTPTLEPPI